jgi:hypothetical protein
LRDQPLRDGARSRRRRSGIRDDQIDLCAAEFLDPARRLISSATSSMSLRELMPN